MAASEKPPSTKRPLNKLQHSPKVAVNCHHMLSRGDFMSQCGDCVLVFANVKTNGGVIFIGEGESIDFHLVKLIRGKGTFLRLKAFFVRLFLPVPMHRALSCLDSGLAEKGAKHNVHTIMKRRLLTLACPKPAERYPWDFLRKCCRFLRFVAEQMVNPTWPSIGGSL